MRVYVLAKELKVESKLLLDICKELGYDHVKNQLSGLETRPDRGGHGPHQKGQRQVRGGTIGVAFRFAASPDYQQGSDAIRPKACAGQDGGLRHRQAIRQRWLSRKCPLPQQ